jgi:hypothetical protein
MPVTLTPALTALQSRLNNSGSGSYVLNATSLTGTNLVSLLESYLGLSSPGSLTVSSSTGPVNQAGNLVLAGTANLLGLINAAVTVIFVDAAGGTDTTPGPSPHPENILGNSDPRCLDVVIAITPPSSPAWKFSTSFPALANSLFDLLNLTSPKLLFSSRAGLPVTPPGETTIKTEFGLSFAGFTTLTGPLLRLGNLTGIATTVPQSLSGPIGFTASPSAVPLLYLSLPNYSVPLTPYPTALILSVILQTLPGSTAGTVAASIALGTTLTVSGIGAIPLSGTLPATGLIGLSYAFDTPPDVNVNALNPWNAVAPIVNSLPTGLRTVSFTVAAAGMALTDSPAAVQSTSFTLTTTSNWSLSGGTALNRVSVQLQATSPTVVNAAVSGYVPVTDAQQPGKTVGVAVSASSDSGFANTVSFSRATQPAQIFIPSLAALAAFNYPAWAAALPGALSTLGTAITISQFTLTLDSTGLATAWTASASSSTAAWALLDTPVALALTSIQVQAASTSAGVSSAAVSGNIALGSPATFFGFAATITGSSFTSYNFALQASQTPTLGALSTSLCGTATPTWIAPLALSAGNLQITPGSLSALSGAFTVGASSIAVPVNQGCPTPSTLKTFTGFAIGYAGSAVTATLSATWEQGSTPLSYTGTVAYPYTSFNIGGGNTVPIPAQSSPPGPPDPDKAMEIAAYVIAAAGAAVTVGTVAAAIWAACQGGGYAAVADGAGAVAHTIWTRLAGQLTSRAKWLLGGMMTAWAGGMLWLIAKTSKDASNDQITPPVAVSAFHANNVLAREAGDAVAQAYSLTPSQLAGPLAGSYSAAATATALFQLYPATYPTATSMVNQLSDPSVFGATLTPRQMAAALAAAGYTCPDVAAALLQKYGTLVNTAALMAPVLQGGWQDAGLTLSSLSMAQGLAACAFALVSTAPVLIPLYSGSTLNDLAVALVSGYQTAAPVSAMQLAVALAAAGQTAAASQTAVENALTGLSPAQWTSIAAVAFATGQGALLALVQSQLAAGKTAVAAVQAVLVAQPQVALDTITGNLYAIYSTPNLSGPVLATSIKEGYGANPPAAANLNTAVVLTLAPAAQTARTMIALLAAAGYAVTVVAPAAAQNFPTTAGTAALLAPLLQGGYQDAGVTISAPLMAAGLAACSFSLIQSVPAMVPLYGTLDLPTLTTNIVTAWAITSSPASALQMAQGLLAAGKTQQAVSPALHVAMPSLSATQMLAVLAATFDSMQPAAATLAQQNKTAGQTVSQSATAIVTAQPQIDSTVLAGVLYAVFSPPNLAPTPLAQAAAAGLAARTDASLLADALLASYAPVVLTAVQVAQALVAAISGATAVQVATALKAAQFSRADALAALTAAGFTQTQATAAIIQVYGGTSVQLLGNASAVHISATLAPTTGTGDFTLEIWVKANTGQGGILFYHQGDVTSHYAGFNLQADSSGSLGFCLQSVGGSSVSYQNNAPVMLFDGQPHALAAVRQTVNNVTTMSLYLDGLALPGAPSAPPLIDVTIQAPLYIGSPNVLGASWVGTVWNACLWSEALSATVIAQHAAAGGVTAPQAGLVGFWPMTDGTTNDQSGNGNNGVLTGGAVIVQPS